MNNFEKLFPYITDITDKNEEIDYDKINYKHNKIVIEQIDEIPNNEKESLTYNAAKTTTEKSAISDKTNNEKEKKKSKQSITLPENIKEIDYALRNIKKLQSALNGNPIGFIDLFNTDGKMNNALTIIKQMPSIMRALGNDNDSNDNLFRESTKADSDIYDTTDINIKTQSNSNDNQQTIIFNLNNGKSQNYSESAKFKIRQEAETKKSDVKTQTPPRQNNENFSDEKPKTDQNKINNSVPDFMNFFNGFNGMNKGEVNQGGGDSNNMMNMLSNVMKMQSSMQNSGVNPLSGNGINPFAFQPDFSNFKNDNKAEKNKSFMEQINDCLNNKDE